MEDAAFRNLLMVPVSDLCLSLARAYRGVWGTGFSERGLFRFVDAIQSYKIDPYYATRVIAQ